MSIKLGSAPADAMNIVQQGLATLYRASPRRQMRGGALVNAKILEPQEVFNLSLDALAGGEDLGSARPAGWRYLISEGKEQLIEAASVSPKPGGAGHEFIGVNQGALIADAGEAMSVAETLEVVQMSLIRV